jgi:GNAT superfamily N-acetyltransferase
VTGRPGETLYYLQMRTPTALQPPKRMPLDLVLQETTSPELVRRLTLEIGTPYDWPSSRWDDARWSSYLSRDDLRHWLAVRNGTPVGLASLCFGPPALVELDTFGLPPRHIGAGLGGAFLTMVVQQAWRELPTANAMMLETSSRDHPHALRNYERRGFHVHRVQLPAATDTDQVELAADVLAHARAEFARYDEAGYELGGPYGNPLSEGREPELHELKLGHWWQGSEDEVHVVDAGRGLQLVYRNGQLAYPVLHPIERFHQAVAHQDVELEGSVMHYGGWH